MSENQTTSGGLRVAGGMYPPLPILFCGPKYTGAWELPGGDNITCVRFMTARKPRWIHRVFMRLLLGWKWVPDAK